MINPSTLTLPSNNRSRVKLYTLNEERQWADRGTGFVTCATSIPPNTNPALIVKSEVDGSTLLHSKILFNTKYQKQQVVKKTKERNHPRDLCDCVLFCFRKL